MWGMYMNRNIALRAALAVSVCSLATSAFALPAAKPYFIDKNFYGATIRPAGDLSFDTNGKSAPIFNGPTQLVGFEGISQYDGASFGRNFVPPDTMGAVGQKHYVETSNGAYAVFDKYTGAQLSLVSDVAFWAAAGQTGTNGDSRVLYNAAAKRWVAVAFGANAKDLQIAVSDNDNALGGWKSTKFEGYGGFGFGATADYPTLAIDANAVYIGTNNFAPGFAGGPNSFRGVALNVIPLNSLFNAAAPTTANRVQFVNPFTGTASDTDGGFALQGVNSSSSGSTGKVLAASLFFEDTLAIEVNGLTANSALGSSASVVAYLGEASYTAAGAGRQPSVALAANQRIISTLDERISSSVYEANGRLYMVHTVDPLTDTGSFARVHYVVADASTYAILDEGDIGTPGFDTYQGSIAVNRLGQVVIGYNRSGLDPAEGKIRFYAETFNTDASGKLVATSGALLLKESLVDDYHNGSIIGRTAAGRQRWGDYSQVSIDPSTSHGFYLIGQFAREYNTGPLHPLGTGGSRWGTWIAGIDVGGVPEPESWAMLIAGFGIVGAAARRQRRMASVVA